MNADAETQLPPGRTGLPYFGEMPRMLRDSFAFIEHGARRHGPIFRTRLLGRHTAIVTGPEASALFIDEDRISRSGAMLPHIQALFGGLSLPVMDGPAHHARKEVVMEAFTHAALGAYMPATNRLVTACLDNVASGDQTRMVPVLARLGMDVLCQAVLGFPAGSDLEGLLADYAKIMRGLVSLPVPFPGTNYSSARKALERALGAHRANIDRHQRMPAGDGLSRMLTGREQVVRAGHDVTLDALAVEAHHLLVAGMIVWSWLAAALVALDKQPALRDRVAEEISRVAPRGPLDLQSIAAMPYLRQIVDEIRRHTPVLQLAWGRARRTFTFAGYTVPENWMVLWGVRSSHMRPEIYPDPGRFDPERFSPARAEHRAHPCAFVPNGAGGRLGHICAGYELAPLLVSVFVVHLVRDYDWQVPPDQDLEFNFTKAPPEPRDGLRVHLRHRPKTPS